MKKLSGIILAVFMLVPLIAFSSPAQAMSASDAQAIVDEAYQAVENTLATLEAANRSGDTTKINLAMGALVLAVQNYSAAGRELDKIQAGNSGDDSALTSCGMVASDLNNFNAQMAAGNMRGARALLSLAQNKAASQPPFTGNIPGGLASLASRINSAGEQAAAILASGGGGEGGDGGDSGTGGDTGTQGLGINTQVGSPI